MTLFLREIIFINSFKLLLVKASSYQGELFTIGSTLWGWRPPQFHNIYTSS